ncbi:MAG: cardiolipin synthase, partial [Rhodospirillales bacterium]|nr:cardiolipin synthase [Rhodospirillales bacterium]
LQIQDTQFRIEGPVVAQLRDVFADDWLFTTGEAIDGPAWFPELAEAGDASARVIDDGPDENLDRLRWTLLGALASATTRVCIATPYFLPDEGLITGLAMAARRGVHVEIQIPETNNLLLVGWASTAQLWQVLEPGCQVYLVPPPFDHTKLMVVDGAWSLVGSANWDARSLRLNFELDVECYSPALAGRLEALLDDKRRRAKELHLADVDARSTPIRLRDGLARLLTPYL